MIHIPQLIIDLGLILAVAAVVTLLFKKLKQPLVLGYIIAGLLVSPNFKLFPSITDHENIEVWAEIGVIILLFSLGLEFSFKKLIKVGGSSSITAFVQIICMIFLGYLTGQLLHWSQMDSIFLGAILSMSSTTIILRAFDELNVKNKKFAGVVFGALIMEDIVAIVLMVLLSTIAVSREFAGWDMLFSISKLLFFLILWFVSGIFFIPTFLKKAKVLMNDETMLIVSLGLCFVMVFLAGKAGFSPALGAFIMGSILAETRQGEKIEHLVKPVKDLFGAVFFISVGMLINPSTLLDYIWPIVIVTLITIIGKTIGTMLGALLSGQPLKQSVQAGMSLAQIGEFSFIIATLGVTLKVTSDFLYPIVVAVSAITTFTTPYFIKASTPVYNWLEKKLPPKLINKLAGYSSATDSIKSVSDWRVVVRATIVQVIVCSVILTGVSLIASKYIEPMFVSGRNGNWIPLIITVVTFLISSPFIWALAIRKIQPERTVKLLLNAKYKTPLHVLQLIRILIAMFFVGMILNNLLSSYVAFGAFVLVAIIIGFNYKKLQLVYDKIEQRFITNFNEKEKMEEKESGSHLAPWDAHMASFTLSPDFTEIGTTLNELQLREKLGINIVLIKRGDFTIMLPQRDERLYPSDILHVIGTDEQLEAFRNYLQEHSKQTPVHVSTEDDILLQQMEVKKNSEFIGKTIKDSAIRERTKGLVVGIERDGNRILNPSSTLVLHEKDVLWIAGNRKRLRLLAAK